MQIPMDFVAAEESDFTASLFTSWATGTWDLVDPPVC